MSIRATPAPSPSKLQSNKGIALEVVKLPEAKRGFVLLPRRWVVERSFAWATRCRRLVKDYERYGRHRGRPARRRLRMPHTQVSRYARCGSITPSREPVEWRTTHFGS